MSHFTRVKTQIIDVDCLLKALDDLGYHTVETGSELHLRGYHGDDRAIVSASSPNYAPPCEIAIRQQYLTSASNDIGFKLQDDGTYEIFISEYDTGALRGWAENVTQRYAYHVVCRQAEYAGYTVIEETNQQDGSIQLVCQRWG